MGKRHLEYIRVKRNNKIYKVYLRDLKNVVRRERKERPPVPIFEEKPEVEICNKSIADTRNSVMS
jgi:hypothetical protein